MGILKRFNREQLTLGAAGLLGVLLFGWQLSKGGGEAASAALPTSERILGSTTQSQIEFIAPTFDPKGGGNPWEPPAAGRVPVPEIRPPEPRLGQLVLPPLSPRPDDADFNQVLLLAKTRSLAAAPQATAPAGFPSEGDIKALKDLPEPDSSRVVDRRKQKMRDNGLHVVHRIDLPPLEGDIVLEMDQTSEGALRMKVAIGTGFQSVPVPAPQIDKNKPGTDEGIERGWEYGRQYLHLAKKVKPDDVDGHRKLGEWCREKAGMFPEAKIELKAAVEALQKKQETGGRARDIVLYFADTLREMGDYDGAIGALQAYIDAVRGTTNDAADLHLRLGNLYSDLGYYERGLISYDAGFQLEPGRAPPQVALARARLSLGETRLAMEQMDSLLGGGSTDASAYVVQGIARLRRGMADLAEASFNEALKTKPDDAEALNGLGVAYALQNKPEAPAKFFAAIKANQYLVEAWLNLGILYLAAGRPEEAGVLLAGAAQRDPGNAVAAAGPGFLAVLKGAFAEARSAFERAQKVQPDDFYVAYALGRLDLREASADAALKRFRDSLKANPDYLPATNDAALAYLMLARDQQRKAASSPPDKQAQFRELVEKYRGHAQTLLEASGRSDSSSYSANMALGCVYAVRGKVRDATQAFERASSSRLGVPDPLNDYGRGYLEYWYGSGQTAERLDAADLRFKNGAGYTNLQDPSDIEWKNECAKASQAVEDWKTHRILIHEPFDGNALSATNQWIVVAHATAEPQVRYANNQAVLGDSAGTSPTMGFAALEHRDLSKDAFLSVEWTLQYEATQGFVSGFSLYITPIAANNQGHGLHFVLQEDAVAPAPKPLKLLYSSSPADRMKGPNLGNPLATLPAAPNRLRFKLERVEIDAGNWRFMLSVWDDAKAAWKPLTDGKNEIKVPRAQITAPGMTMQFWARSSGMSGRKWGVGLDDVRVLVVEK